MTNDLEPLLARADAVLHTPPGLWLYGDMDEAQDEIFKLKAVIREVSGELRERVGVEKWHGEALTS
jgi:hypothetical protein